MVNFLRLNNDNNNNNDHFEYGRKISLFLVNKII